MSKPDAIDLDDARAYIAAVAGAPDAVVTFQTFTDRKPNPCPADWVDPLKRVLHGTLDQRKKDLVNLNNRGAGIFLMVNSGDGRGRSAENVVGITALFTDDDKNARKTPALPPSFIVESKAGPHTYWKLNPGTPLEVFTPAQKQLAAYYGTDAAVVDLPRVMRVPGFFHHKGEPHLVTFHPGSFRAYEHDEVLAAHPVAAAPPPPPPVRAASDSVRREKLVGLVRAAAAGRPWTEGDRHASAMATATHARKLGLEEADIRAIVADFLLRAGKTTSEAEQIVKYTLAKVAPDPKEQRPANVVHIPTADAVVIHEPIIAAPDRWPAPLDEAAYYGILGELARLIAPHTEADPVAVLAHELVFFGNAVGHAPHFRIGASRHYTVENCILVGDTSKGRKGTAEAEARRPYQILEDPWTGRLASGLSTGEGLLHAVRDAVEKDEPIREGKGRNGRIIGTERVVVDPGESDKRLASMESEWGRVLRAMERDASTLSSVIRQLYDCPRTAEVKTRNNPIRATDPHVSIVGHITRDELLRYLDRTDQANGFANRFLYLLVRRSRELPDGGSLTDSDVRPIAARLGRVLETARAIGELKRTKGAQKVWEAVYGPLSRARDGILGGITSRAEAHVLRLSMIYSLSDGRDRIDVPHLEAALALWTYAEDSAECVFGSSLGNPDADEIVRNLAHAPGGLTRTELHACFGRNLPEHRLTMALDLLNRRGLARGVREITPGQRGRPTERWFSTSPDARKNEMHEINAPAGPAPTGDRGPISSNSFSRTPEHRECAS